MTNRRPRPVASLIIALVITALAAVWLGRTVWWCQHAERVIGRAGHSSHTSASTARSAGTPVVHVTFSTLAGEGKTLALTTWSTRTHLEGSPVPVVYDPHDPSDARVAVWWNLWLLPSLAVAGGMALLARVFWLRRSD